MLLCSAVHEARHVFYKGVSPSYRHGPPCLLHVHCRSWRRLQPRCWSPLCAGGLHAAGIESRGRDIMTSTKSLLFSVLVMNVIWLNQYYFSQTGVFSALSLSAFSRCSFDLIANKAGVSVSCNRPCSDRNVPFGDIYIEEVTHAQSLCPTWHEERRFRVTATLRKKIVARRKEDVTSVIREKLRGKFPGNVATRYGIANEPVSLKVRTVQHYEYAFLWWTVILSLLLYCRCNLHLLILLCLFIWGAIKGEVHGFYKTSWFVEFEALSRMVKVQGSCDKPF